MNEKLSAIYFSVALALAGCAKSPDSEDTRNQILASANAQGGVCMNQSFPVMFGERSYSIAKPTAVAGETTTLSVQTHYPSSQSSLIRGDSSFSDNVKIENFPLKSEEECTFTSP